METAVMKKVKLKVENFEIVNDEYQLTRSKTADELGLEVLWMKMDAIAEALGIEFEVEVKNSSGYTYTI